MKILYYFIVVILTVLLIIQLVITPIRSGRTTHVPPAENTEKVVAIPDTSGQAICPDDVAGVIHPVIPVPIPDSLDFAGEPVPLHLFYIREYLDRELLVNTYWHSSTLLLLKRANRWMPVIEPILAKNGIPDDMKYVAMIESGLENVTSPAGATGYWQFLKSTARQYGLEVNDDVDERYHVEKSTEAACRYLREAYSKFGNWTLVAASYNAGMKRISEVIKKQRVSSYYDLQLVNETTRYIFRVLAIKTIFESPSQYGFMLEQKDLYPAIPYKTVTVTRSIDDLVDFAIQQGVSYKVLKLFNPWLQDDELPNHSGKSYQIKIPREGYLDYSKIVTEQAETSN